MAATSWGDVVVAIPTVLPARSVSLAALVGQVSEHCQGALVVIHPHVHGTPARMDFPRLLTAAARVGRPWILQLEDDAHLAPTFGAVALDEGLDHADCVSLFSRRKDDREAYEQGHRVRRRSPKAFCSTVGFFLRRELAVGVEAFAPEFFERHPHHVHASDLVLAEHLAAEKARVLVRLPSLVQHKGLPSTLPGRGGVRQSEMYRMAFGEVPA